LSFPVGTSRDLANSRKPVGTASQSWCIESPSRTGSWILWLRSSSTVLWSCNSGSPKKISSDL